MALCEVLTQEEIAKIALEIKRISDAGGWGELRLIFKRGRMGRPVTVILPQYEEEGKEN
jgi:hypothetical protein